MCLLGFSLLTIGALPFTFALGLIGFVPDTFVYAHIALGIVALVTGRISAALLFN